MAGWIDNTLHALSARRTALRRARNLRAPRQAAVLTAAHWIGAFGVLAAIGGAVLIAAHARYLARETEPAIGNARQAGLPVPVEALRAALPGVAFRVPASGIVLQREEAGALLIAAGVHAASPVRIDLCNQRADRARPRLALLRIGVGFDDVARLAGDTTLRSIALAAPGGDMPQVQVSGNALADFDAPLTLAWQGKDGSVRWIGDGRVVEGMQGSAPLREDGWLLWGEHAALHVQRRTSAACASSGELVLQVFRTGGEAGKALVAASPLSGRARSAWLAAGSYRIAAPSRGGLEDQALFEALQQRGLVRLGADGLIELAPADLAAWQAAPDAARGALAGWGKVKLDDEAAKLLRRVYRMADGDYVREQIRVFNGERRLLAWRADGAWQASSEGAALPTTAAMPAAAARLFASVVQGWAPWTRVASDHARIALPLTQAARGGESMRLMLIGQPLAVRGARIKDTQEACTGRACRARDDVRVLTLELEPGARSVAIDARALDMSSIGAPGDEQYRHLRVADGRLAWHAVAPSVAAPPARAADVTLTDRNGALLWSDGAPTPAAIEAGLATMLGIRADHANSVAGMLARLPNAHHEARLTLDLPLQLASQQALACIGMHRGRWDGAHCSGGEAVPADRHAGIVILDTETGDVLAAAGAGGAAVTAANWPEVRDFDRLDPARSPLRLPALQHDGGAHSSPGSTFKVISALGLEQAAQRDPQIEALLGGMPLPALNRLARDKGFAFQTDAAVYPVDTRLAHITNYKDQGLSRRAQDGKLGLAQALTYSLNTWFAWSGELSDRSLFGRPQGGAPDLQPLELGALDSVRPIVGMAHRLGFEQTLRLDGGLLPADYPWAQYDALQATAAHIDPVRTRHELRQMAIGLRMQVTPLQMALAAAAVGEGKIVGPRLLLSLDAKDAPAPARQDVGVRLDRIRAGMKGVIDVGTAAAAFRGARFDALRRGLAGKTGTSPTSGEEATVWFTGYLEPRTLPGQTHRLAVAAFVSHSEATGGEHAAPIVAAVLASRLGQNQEQKGK